MAEKRWKSIKDFNEQVPPGTEVYLYFYAPGDQKSITTTDSTAEQSCIGEGFVVNLVDYGYCDIERVEPRPIEDILEETVAKIPLKDWKKLPSDLNENMDKHLRADAISTHEPKPQPEPVRFLARNKIPRAERYLVCPDEPVFKNGEWQPRDKFHTFEFPAWQFETLFPNAPRLEPGEGPVPVRLNLEVVDDE